MAASSFNRSQNFRRIREKSGAEIAPACLPQQAKRIPPFAKTAKSGPPSKSKTQLRSELLDKDHA